jgi:hypothetical protein
MVHWSSAFLAASSLWLASTTDSAALPCRSTSTPVVAVKNGSYAGVHSSEYNQDFFLGMPYAQVRSLLRHHRVATLP